MAVVVRVPLVVVPATIVSVALAPPAKVPMFQVRLLPAKRTVPCEALVESTLTDRGRELLTITLVAALGPRLVTEIT